MTRIAKIKQLFNRPTVVALVSATKTRIESLGQNLRLKIDYVCREFKNVIPHEHFVSVCTV